MKSQGCCIRAVFVICLFVLLALALPKYNVSAKQASDNFPVNVKKCVKKIRKYYNNFQKNKDNKKKYRKLVEDNYIIYIDKAGNMVSFIAKPKCYDDIPENLKKATAYYYYNLEDDFLAPYFVYVENGKKQYRFYLYDFKIIRYVDPNGKIYDYKDGESIGDFQVDESFFATMSICEIAMFQEGE